MEQQNLPAGQAGKTGKPAFTSGRYLKYAIGEIILVVIGILIAIQLNEWRLDSTNNNQKQIVLKALKVEFEANLQQMDTILFYTGKVLKSYPVVNELIKNLGENSSEVEMQQVIVNLAYTWTFNPSNGALRSAISSSEIHLLDNSRLIELLFSWEDVVKDSEEEAVRMRKYQYDSNSSILTKYVRVSDTWGTNFPGFVGANSPSDYKSLFQDVAFEDYTGLSYAYAFEYIRELKVIKNQNKEILTLISAEIKE
jgi:Family of unknown function (DUF6090)